MYIIQYLSALVIILYGELDQFGHGSYCSLCPLIPLPGIGNADKFDTSEPIPGPPCQTHQAPIAEFYAQ